jgi:hypothetical protein
VLLLPEPLFLPFPLPLPLSLPLPPEDMAVPVAVCVEAVAAVVDTLLLRAWNRTRRHVPRPSSCLACSPFVRDRCGWCGRRETVVTT